MTRHYCTYFDSRYLNRGLALYESLRRHGGSFRLFMLCLDNVCHETLAARRLPEVELIALEELERSDAGLLAAKPTRSRIEYYFTLTPCLPLHVLNTRPAVDLVTYLDSDLFFFDDPEPLFEELGAQSVAVIAHRFGPRLQHLARNGIYNVGWLSFRRDANGLACLQWWRERCLEWCYDRLEGNRYADQKYLDEWPGRFAGVNVLQHKGANLAPWNFDNYAITNRGGRVYVDDEPLIFYHFQGFKQVRPSVYDTHLAGYHAVPNRVLRRDIYGAYIRALRAIETSAALPGGIRYAAPARSRLQTLIARARKLIRLLRPSAWRTYIFVIGDRIL